MGSLSWTSFLSRLDPNKSHPALEARMPAGHPYEHWELIDQIRSSQVSGSPQCNLSSRNVLMLRTHVASFPRNHRDRLANMHSSIKSRD